MATLNGTQINQTYSSLIKLVDNGLASGTLKELTDGQGNGLGVFVNTSGALTTQGDINVQGILDSTGGNKISFLFANQAAFPSATTYHGAIAHSHADGKMYFAHSGSWVELANASDLGDALTADDNTVEIVSDVIGIKDDGIGHDQLSNRYTASAAVTSGASITIDTSTADIFTWTAAHSAIIDFTNVKIGDVVTLEITGGSGSYTLTLQNINASAGTFNKISGDYDDTVKNLIEFKFISSTEAWYQISQIAI